MNKLTVTLLWVSTLGFLPLLAHFELLPGVLDMAMGLIPSYAILLALLLAVDPGSVSPAQAWFAYGYLVIWCGVGWWWALREYTRSIVTDGK
jgi:hypothetical protein